MIQTRKCKHCGAEFVPVRNDSRIKYCSRECKERDRWKNKREDLNSATLERYKKIVELYDSDYSVAEIAELFDCSVTVVYTAWKKAGLSKRMTKLQKEVKALREKGMCCVEIADALGKSCSNISAICDVIGLPFTEDEVQKSIELGKAKSVRIQWGDVGQRRQKQIDFISEHYPHLEYVSGYIASDDFVELRCKECGLVFKRSAVTLRHTECLTSCPICEEKRKQEELVRREAEKEAQKQERERERAEAFWSQKFQQVSFKMCQCKECGAFFIGGRSCYCSDECKRKHINRKHDKRLDRANRIDKSISLKKLYKRDKGICWICGGKCDYKDYVKDENGYFIVGANYPSIDHVYPLSKGGNHEWSNVKLAHHYCNTLKNDKVVAYG